MFKPLKIIFILLSIGSCSTNDFQSAWHPASVISMDIKELAYFLIVVCSLVFSAVAILLFLALKKRDGGTGVLSPGNKFILWTGLIIPSLILVIMLHKSLDTTISVRGINKINSNVMTIKVIGHQWWWEIHYPDYSIVTANEIYLPIDTNIRLELLSKDVIHSFWVPNIHGKMDMLPNFPTTLNINVNKTGIYRGICAEFCGKQHALMSLYLKAIPENDFNQWINQKQKAPKKNLTHKELQGKAIFFEQSCHTCHAVKGTEAVGKSGPDLTHLATRLSLGAGTIDNNPENLAHWILHSQKIKPANRMPNYKISKEDLDDLLTWLEGLK